MRSERAIIVDAHELPLPVIIKGEQGKFAVYHMTAAARPKLGASLQKPVQALVELILSKFMPRK